MYLLIAFIWLLLGLITAVYNIYYNYQSYSFIDLDDIITSFVFLIFGVVSFLIVFGVVIQDKINCDYIIYDGRKNKE